MNFSFDKSPFHQWPSIKSILPSQIYLMEGHSLMIGGSGKDFVLITENPWKISVIFVSQEQSS
jgi:hypothetical protein